MGGSQCQLITASIIFSYFLLNHFCLKTNIVKLLHCAKLIFVSLLLIFSLSEREHQF